MLLEKYSNDKGCEIFTEGKNNLWLKYRPKKNELLARVKLLPEAIALVEKCDENRETLFPIQPSAT
jgi:hypothetical protein